MEIAEMKKSPVETSQASEKSAAQINVGDTERWASGIAGTALSLYGLKRRGLFGMALAALGGGLLYRGVSGNCQMYSALGIDTARKNGEGEKGVQQGILLTKNVIVRKPRQELFTFWRDFTNLPKFMRNLECVECKANGTSHWVAKGPLNSQLEWDAEIINEIPGELIAWQSLENADVRNAGSVHFTDNFGGETFVKVTMQYLPPAGRVGDAVAKIFGENPAEVLEENLLRFKQLMESGMAEEFASEDAVEVSGT